MLKLSEGLSTTSHSEQNAGGIKQTIGKINENTLEILGDNFYESFINNEGTLRILSMRILQFIQYNGLGNQKWGIKIFEQGGKIILEHNRGAKLIWDNLDELQNKQAPIIETIDDDNLWSETRQLKVLVETLQNHWGLKNWWIK